MNQDKPIKIFISYAHKAEHYKDELITFLAPLKRQGIIDTWQDRSIESGEWNEQIQNAMKEATIFVFLVERYFLSSNYIVKEEIRIGFEKFQKKEAKLFPIICEHCDWSNMPMTKDDEYKEFNPQLNRELHYWMGKLQAFPKDAKPIKSWDDDSEAYQNVINSLKREIAKM